LRVGAARAAPRTKENCAHATADPRKCRRRTGRESEGGGKGPTVLERFEVLNCRPPRQRRKALSTMAHVVDFGKNRNKRRPQRLLYRAGITRDELARLVLEVGRDQIEAALRALDLPIGPVLTPAE